MEYLSQAQALYESHWLLAFSLFCILHLLCSSFGVPGGCTALNFISGALFGFALGCAIVYPLTLLGGSLMYAIGRHFSGKELAARYQVHVSKLTARMGRGDFLFFVSLRLSPFLPFGLINVLCGWLKVPFGLFFASTTVGIFFDVTLLNSLGAAVRVGVADPKAPQVHSGLIAAFLILLGVFWGVRSFLLKETDRIRL